MPPRVALPQTSKKITEYFPEIKVSAALLKVFAIQLYEIQSCYKDLEYELLLRPDLSYYAPELHVKEASNYICHQRHILVTMFVYRLSSEASFWNIGSI